MTQQTKNTVFISLSVLNVIVCIGLSITLYKFIGQYNSNLQIQNETIEFLFSSFDMVEEYGYKSGVKDGVQLSEEASLILEENPLIDTEKVIEYYATE